MTLPEKIAVGLLCFFLLIVILRLFSAPLRLALKVLLNSLLGFAALAAVNLTGAWTGLALGLNFFNALVIGVLGLPGLVLLILLELIFL